MLLTAATFAQTTLGPTKIILFSVGQYTAATLNSTFPPATWAYYEAWVTDGPNCGTGGGATLTRCYSNGTQWVAFSGGGGGGTANYQHNGLFVGTQPTLDFEDTGGGGGGGGIGNGTGNPWFDARANGAFADCDPTTGGGAGSCAHDDTVALQTTINQACTSSNTGGVAFIPPGFYNVTSSLIVPTGPAGRSCRIEGTCAGTTQMYTKQSNYGYAPAFWKCSTLVNYTDNDTLVLNGVNTGVDIKGIRFWSTSHVNKLIHLHVTAGQIVTNITIHYNEFLGGASAIYADSADNASTWFWLIIDHNAMQAQFQNALDLISPTGSISGPNFITHNWIDHFGTAGATNCVSTYTNCAIQVQNVNQLVISENQLGDQDAPGGAGIGVLGGNAITFEKNDVEAVDNVGLLSYGEIDVRNITTYCIPSGIIISAALQGTIGTNFWVQGPTGCMPVASGTRGTVAVTLSNTQNVTVTTPQTISGFTIDVLDQPASGKTDNVAYNTGVTAFGPISIKPAAAASLYSAMGLISGYAGSDPVWKYYRPTGSGSNAFPWYVEAGCTSGFDFCLKTGTATTIGAESVTQKFTFKSNGVLDTATGYSVNGTSSIDSANNGVFNSVKGVGAGGVGYVMLTPGSATQTGYVGWFNATPTRTWYAGFDTNNDLTFQGIGGNFKVSSSGGNMQLNGFAFVDASGNVTSGNGANIVYRCATAGTLPIGALTITTGNCGTTADTGLRVK